MATNVKIGANTSDFQKQMSQVTNNLSRVTSECALASTRAELFGNKTEQLSARQKLLSEVINGTASKIALYSGKITDLNSDTDKLNSRQSELTSNLDETNKAYLESVNATGKNSAESKKLAKEISDMEKEYAKNNKAIANNDTELTKTTTAMNKAETAMLKDQQALESVSEELDNSTSKLGKFKDKIKNIGDSEGFKKLDSAINNVAKGLGIALLGGLTLATKSASDYKQALNDLAVKTGATTEEQEALGESIKKVYGDNFGGTMQEVAEAIALVKTNTGLVGDELTNITEFAMGFSDSFGIDVAESTRTVKALMDNFGVSADEAFNLMVQGQQNGLDYSGELLDSINEYSGSFGKSGLSAEEMFNVLQSGADAGSWNLDKVGDAVKELNIKLIDGSKTTVEGLEAIGMNSDEVAKSMVKGGDSATKTYQEVIGKLAKMDDKVLQNTTGVNLFGTQWEDVGADVIAALSNVEGGYDKTKTSAEEMNKVKYDDPLSAFQGIGRMIQTEVLLPVGEQMLPLLNDLANWFKGEGGAAIREGMAKFIEKMPTIAETIGNAFSSISNAIKFVMDNSSWLIPVLGTLLFAIMAFKTIVIISEIMTAYGVIMTALEASTILTTISTGAMSIATGIWNVVCGIATIATSALGIAFAFLTSPIGLIILAIAAVIAIGILLYKNWDTVKEVAMDVFGAIGNFIGGVCDSVGGFFKGMINGIIDGINWMIGAINGISLDLPDVLGGGHIGFNLPTMNYLNQGGIIDSPTLLGGNTVVGDAWGDGEGKNAEAVIPLDSMYKNIDNITKKNIQQQSANNQPIYVIVNVDNNMDSKKLADTVTTKVTKAITKGQNSRNIAKGVS